MFPILCDAAAWVPGNRISIVMASSNRRLQTPGSDPRKLAKGDELLSSGQELDGPMILNEPGPT